MNGRRWLFGWLLAAMMMSSAWAQMPYRDPADRFVLNVPKPWTIANADARAVVLVNGNASLTATWAD
ncbi:MAG: hypothetical protein KIT73_05190, partial [Burkholderiales bacterium]|nr:hypothetical protein [Burkholderiales bacterium]